MKFIPEIKNYFGAALLLAFSIKALYYTANISDAIIIGILAALTGWQIYLAHLRLQKLHQKQINKISNDIANIKSIVSVVQMNTQARTPQLNRNPFEGYSWGGITNGKN